MTGSLALMQAGRSWECLREFRFVGNGSIEASIESAELIVRGLRIAIARARIDSFQTILFSYESSCIEVPLEHAEQLVREMTAFLGERNGVSAA